MVFRRDMDKDSKQPSKFKERIDLLAAAYYCTEAKFDSIPNGSHSLGFEAAIDLIGAMQVSPGDITWEIGCGVPCLAMTLSAAAFTTVICTDIDDVHKSLKCIMNGHTNQKTQAEQTKQLGLLRGHPIELLNKTVRDYYPHGKGSTKARLGALLALSSEIPDVSTQRGVRTILVEDEE